MYIKQIPIKHDETRPAFEDIPHGMQVFYKGVRVLSAYDYENPNNTSIYFEKEHEIGEPGWPEGGYECRDIGQGFRAFYKDALILHPSQYRVAQSMTYKKSGRGRPKQEKIQLDTEGNDVVKVKGSRGRPRKYEPGTSPSDIKKAEYASQERKKRGRPKLDPSQLKPKPEKVSTGERRGRPRLYEPGQSPSELKKLEKAKNIGTNRRGRPRKTI